MPCKSRQLSIGQTLTHCSLFPLASLALDLPHYLPRILFLWMSMMSWVTFTGHSMFTNMSNPSFEHGFRNFSKVAVLMLTTFIASSGIWITHLTGGHYGVWIRFCVNALCCIHLAISWCEPTNYGIGQYVRIFYLVVAGFFGTAALLCSVAWAKRHQWVSGVTLGGTAIEPMVLTVPGGGPRYQSVGDEARGGAIRLV